jgi:hypothetical protein
MKHASLRRVSAAGIAALALLAACSQSTPTPKPAEPVAAAPSAPKPPGPVVKEELKQIEATVEAVDAATRAVTLRGPNREVTLIAGPEVRNFSQIKVGDRMVASYYVAVTAQLGSSSDSDASGGGVQPMSTTSTSTYAAPVGSRPAGAVARTTTMTVKIESVDTAAETVSFTRPDGTHRTVEADSPEMREFLKTLAPGDEVDVTYTEAVAVEMHPVP